MTDTTSTEPHRRERDRDRMLASAAVVATVLVCFAISAFFWFVAGRLIFHYYEDEYDALGGQVLWTHVGLCVVALIPITALLTALAWALTRPHDRRYGPSTIHRTIGRTAALWGGVITAAIFIGAEVRAAGFALGIIGIAVFVLAPVFALGRSVRIRGRQLSGNSSSSA